MNRNHWRLVLVWVLWAALGCGASSDVAVTGTVTLDGQPFTNALVTFYPEGKTPGLGGNGRFCQVSEVWLLKEASSSER